MKSSFLRAVPLATIVVIGLAFSLTPSVTVAVLAASKLSPEELKAPDVSSFTLDNGMQVVVIPDNRAPVVTHMVWYRAGSADEPPGKSGIAHYLEHLMFKGTKTVKNGEFSARIAEIGGSENAFTSTDYTAYFQRVSPDSLEEMMRLEADRMENLVLTDEIVLPERDVIQEERNSRTENNPGALLGEAVSATLYQNHPYGIPIIGWQHEVDQLTKEDAIAFYDQYYTPNNAVLVVAGNVTPERVKELAEKTYGQVKRRAEPGIRKRPQEPRPRAARIVKLSDERVRSPGFQRQYLAPSFHNAKDGEAEALEILGEIIGGSSTSRLYRDLVRDKSIATSVGSYYRGGALDDTTFVVYGTPKPGHSISEVETAVEANLAALLEKGVTQEEVDRSIDRLLKSMVFSRDSQSTLARIYGSSLMLGETLESIASYPARLSKVTAEQVNAVARKYLKAPRSVTGYLLPKGATVETKG